MNPESSPMQRIPGRAAGSDPPGMPVPDKLNLVLSLAVFGGAIVLIWLASMVKSWLAVFGIGVLFSYLLLTDYALMHEATHGNLQSNPRCNYWLCVTNA